MQQSSHTVMGVTVIAVLLALYSLSNSMAKEIPTDEVSVSLCQIHVQHDGSNTFDDRIVMSLLAKLKMHDFQINQPVWGPADTLLYFCEHRLKTGVQHAIIDKELNNIIKQSPTPGKRLAWSCA